MLFQITVALTVLAVFVSARTGDDMAKEAVTKFMESAARMRSSIAQKKHAAVKTPQQHEHQNKQVKSSDNTYYDRAYFVQDFYSRSDCSAKSAMKVGTLLDISKTCNANYNFAEICVSDQNNVDSAATVYYPDAGCTGTPSSTTAFWGGSECAFGTDVYDFLGPMMMSPTCVEPDNVKLPPGITITQHGASDCSDTALFFQHIPFDECLLTDMDSGFAYMKFITCDPGSNAVKMALYSDPSCRNKKGQSTIFFGESNFGTCDENSKATCSVV
mmetsp:Transcript_60630/g.119339  ORF Transcript_60630/g.119339 Transcript_60630/m.119339 type:complete len:272 (+) Transcript_60630:72-887(+)